MVDGSIGAAGEAADGLLLVQADDRPGDGAHRAPDAGPAEDDSDDNGRDHRGVAILLGSAAIAAAVVGALAAGLSSDASDAWNSAVRSELKRSTGALESIRYVYQAEFPMAMNVMVARARQTAYATAAQSDPANATALTIAANGEANAANAMSGATALTKDDTYALPGGGVDLGHRLADVRAENADLVALDPDVVQAQGDELAAKAHRLLLALLPLGLCALLGTLAQAFRRARLPLLAAGSALLGAGVIVAVVAEVLA